MPGNLKLGLRPEGIITIEKGMKGGEVTERRKFNNIVLDVGWDNLMEKAANRQGILYLSAGFYLFLGSGTSEPSATDTGLESISQTLPGKGKTGFVETSSNTEKYFGIRMEFNYSEGEAEGVWTELGLSFDSAYSKPYNRSLIRDASGNADSLTILSDEFLRVYVELRIYADETPVTGTFLYNGQAINYSAKFEVDYERTNFLDYGWINFAGMYTGTGSSGEKGFLTDGVNPILTHPEVVIDPGSERTFSGFRCGANTGYDIQQYIVATFDPVITIPADHKITLGGFSVEFVRAPVPAS